MKIPFYYNREEILTVYTLIATVILAKLTRVVSLFILTDKLENRLTESKDAISPFSIAEVELFLEIGEHKAQQLQFSEIPAEFCLLPHWATSSVSWVISKLQIERVFFHM